MCNSFYIEIFLNVADKKQHAMKMSIELQLLSQEFSMYGAICNLVSQ